MSIPRAATPPRGGLAEKREAIVAGALKVFARDGYTRATMEAIASEAVVSTRTIYNHFHDKAALFEAVIAESTAIADAHVALMDRHLHKLTDLEADLVAFARAWVTPLPQYEDHTALVRQINAEAAHIPPAAIERWQQLGPLRVLGELAGYLRRFADAGLLRVDDAERAANHFARLVTLNNPSLRPATTSAAEIDDIVESGVHAFLHGYAPGSKGARRSTSVRQPSA